MSDNLPTRDRAGQNPLIASAVVALLAFGDLTREQAAILLPMWRHVGELSEDDRADVVSRFPLVATDAGGWISGPMVDPTQP